MAPDDRGHQDGELIVKDHSQRKIAATVLKFAWTIAVLACVMIVVVRNGEVFRQLEMGPRVWILLSLSLLTTMLRRLLAGLRWSLLVKWYSDRQQQPSLSQSLRVFFVANLAAYLPGTYWFIAWRLVLNRKFGVGSLQTAVVTVLEQFLLVCSGGLVTLVGMGTFARWTNDALRLTWMISLLTVIGLVLIHPKSYQFVVRTIKKRFNRDIPNVSISYPAMIGLLALSLFTWILGSLSLWFLMAIWLPQLSLGNLWEIAPIFAGSWLIGYFTPIAPSGLGVREGVMAIALTTLNLSTAAGFILAMLSRLVIVLADLLGAGICWLLLPGISSKTDISKSA